MRRNFSSIVGKIIDGKRIAKDFRSKMKSELHSKLTSDLRPPALAMVVVGERPDSLSYIRMKNLACDEIGITSYTTKLPLNTSQKELLELVSRLNSASEIDGILVQFPLPKHISPNVVIEAVDPRKDVDGLHPDNFGKLFLKGSEPMFLPCTAEGCMELLRWEDVQIVGKHAVVLGRSNIVGTPVAALLQRANATVTICHSLTPHISTFTQSADILISAVGKPRLWTGNMLKSGCVLIDVGINSVPNPQYPDTMMTVGDADFDSCLEVVGKISPVPGGVGPMTITMLMRNTIKSWKRKFNL